jgi:hypothetical protein
LDAIASNSDKAARRTLNIAEDVAERNTAAAKQIGGTHSALALGEHGVKQQRPLTAGNDKAVTLGGRLTAVPDDEDCNTCDGCD